MRGFHPHPFMPSTNDIRVYQYRKDGTLAAEWPSMTVAERDTGCFNVWRAIRTGRLAGGFYWSLKYWPNAYVKRGKGRQFYGG